MSARDDTLAMLDYLVTVGLHDITHVHILVVSSESIFTKRSGLWRFNSVSHHIGAQAPIQNTGVLNGHPTFGIIK